MSRLGLQRPFRQFYIARANSSFVCSYTQSQQTENTQPRPKTYEEIPGPISLPIIGSTWVLAAYKHPYELGKYLRSKYGNIVRLHNLKGVGDTVVTFDIADIEMMYRNEGVFPYRVGFDSLTYYRTVIRKDVYNNDAGLVTSFNEQWADFRNKVNPILMQPRAVQQHISEINQVANVFIERTKGFSSASPVHEMPTNYVEELHKWALESMGMIALNTRLGCLEDNPSEESQRMVFYMLKIFKMLFLLEFSPLAPFARRFNLPIWQRFVKYQDYFTNKALNLMEDTIERIEHDPDYKLKNEYDKSAFEKLREKSKIVSVIMTLDMLAAGVDTVGKSAATVLYFLATNRDKQEKLRAEIFKFLPGSSDTITQEILVNLPYLRAVIKESLRIAPVATASVRRMTKDVELGGYNIPKGINVMVPHTYMSNHEDHFMKPHEFRPERWMRDDPTFVMKNSSPFLSMPFGFGPRSSIEKRLANLEMEVLIAKMVNNFDIRWNHKPITFGQDLIFGVKDPLTLQLIPLEH